MSSTDWAAHVAPPHALARIVAQDRGSYLVAFPAGELRAQLDGKSLRRVEADPSALPVVGDYVAVDARPAEGTATIRALLPRQNLFARRAAGASGTLQGIAANVDTLFVAVATGGDFNLRRVERYLVAAAAFGVPVALALTKTDLVDDATGYVVAAESVAGTAPVVALAALAPGGLAALAAYRGTGKTIAFVGSSGVGKSTIVNALCGERRFDTGAVRDGDERGRHTTTRRELIVLADGTAVVDTPGMREFALADAEGGVDDAFADVAAAAQGCRFGDCRHDSEPGCAVRAALDPERLASWQKLRREAAFEARKSDPDLARADQAKWKAIQRANRARYRERGR